MVNFEIYADKDKGEACWGWRLKQGDNTIAVCGFHTKESIIDQIKQIKVGKCDIKDLDVDIRIQDLFDGLKPEMLSEAVIKFECKEDDPAHKHKKEDTTPTKGIPGS